MSAATAVPPFVNGTGVAHPSREVDFLQQILRIRDDVLASKHPRIHLPSKVIEQVVPRSAQTAPVWKLPLNGTPNGVPTIQPLPARPAGPPTQAIPNDIKPAGPPTGPAAQRPSVARPTSTSSGIDPVLLTKSAHLIRAELQLKRQQIERQLKDQVDRKNRAHEADEREVQVNVEECLIEAQLRVPPVSGLRPTTNNSDGIESFDENSYYSSKADSWSSEGVEGADVAENVAADIASAGPLTSQAQVPPLPQNIQILAAHPTVIDLDEETYEPADDIEIYQPDHTNLEEEFEEDYSPPPAASGAAGPSRTQTRDLGAGNVPSTNGSSRRHSPAGPAAPVNNPRKRRREEKKRQQQFSKRTVRSPEPYIKEEPQSPPPFASFQETQPNKRRALQSHPDDIDLIPTADSTRNQPIRFREVQGPVRQYREIEEPPSPIVATPQRRMQRDDQDLRRVASVQYARRPPSPNGNGEFFAIEPRQSRAGSYAVVERPEAPVYREMSVRPAAGPRYVRERSRSVGHERSSQLQSPLVMAPPPRRIVVDQYGRKYYAAPVDAVESVPPPPRQIELDPLYERAVTREPSMRLPGRSEVYVDDNGHRMVPPSRRFVEAREPELIEAGPYRREASYAPASGGYRPQEIIERRPVPQYEEMGPPRAYSMRPEAVRSQVLGGYSRHGSMQPGHMLVPQPRYREVSIVQQEPFDERRYAAGSVSQGTRYVDEGPAPVGQEVYGAEPRRVYARY